MPAALQALANRMGLPPESFGLYAQAADLSGRVLASLNAETLFPLASTAKLVTTLAALDILGPHYRWRTFAFLGGPLRQGRLLGDLIIVGGGNVRLSSADLRQWFGRLRVQGLSEIWGDIVLDHFAFRLNEADHVNTPEPSPDRPHHMRPDALMLNEGVLRVSVQGGRGLKPTLVLDPPMPGLRVVTRMNTSGDCVVNVQPEKSGLSPTLSVSGSWRAACGKRELALMPLAHDDYTVRAVEGLWRESGGRLRGRVFDKRAPDRDDVWPVLPNGEAMTPWSVHLSDPLNSMVRDINKTSDNLAARNLMLSMAYGFPLKPATLWGARARVDLWLQGQGLAAGDIEVESGAGLSRGERGKPRALAHLLRRAWQAGSSALFLDSLPVAGVDGTLLHRMTLGPAKGRALLKTGTLLDARALAGYVKCVSGRIQAVVMLAHHPDAARTTPALDAMVEWIAVHG